MPRDVGIAETQAFILGALPGGNQRVLEVGCGDGALAAGLMESGYRVVAIDASPECVAAARQRGVDARLASWPADGGAGGGFDAVLFTRSLHHIGPLEGALDAARLAVASGGVVVVEDFDYLAGGSVGAAWLVWMLRLADAAGLLPEGIGPMAERAGAIGDAGAAWAEAHDHELHGWAKMASALASRVGPTQELEVPYLYRYVADRLEPTARGVMFAREVQGCERGTLGRAPGGLIGRRAISRAWR